MKRTLRSLCVHYLVHSLSLTQASPKPAESTLVVTAAVIKVQMPSRFVWERFHTIPIL